MLIKCQDCQKEISNTANSCPACGWDIAAHLTQVKFEEEEKRARSAAPYIIIFSIVSAIIYGLFTFFFA